MPYVWPRSVCLSSLFKNNEERKDFGNGRKIERKGGRGRGGEGCIMMECKP